MEAPLDAAAAPILINSSLGVGETRLSFALLNETGAPISDAAMALRLFALDAEVGTDRVTGGRLTVDGALAERSLTPGFDHQHPDGVVHAHLTVRTSIYTATVPLD